MKKWKSILLSVFFSLFLSVSLIQIAPTNVNAVGLIFKNITNQLSNACITNILNYIKSDDPTWYIDDDYLITTLNGVINVMISAKGNGSFIKGNSDYSANNLDIYGWTGTIIGTKYVFDNVNCNFTSKTVSFSFAFNIYNNNQVYFYYGNIPVTVSLRFITRNTSSVGFVSYDPVNENYEKLPFTTLVTLGYEIAPPPPPPPVNTTPWIITLAGITFDFTWIKNFMESGADSTMSLIDKTMMSNNWLEDLWNGFTTWTNENNERFDNMGIVWNSWTNNFLGIDSIKEFFGDLMCMVNGNQSDRCIIIRLNGNKALKDAQDVTAESWNRLFQIIPNGLNLIGLTPIADGINSVFSLLSSLNNLIIKGAFSLISLAFNTVDRSFQFVGFIINNVVNNFFPNIIGFIGNLGNLTSILPSPLNNIANAIFGMAGAIASIGLFKGIIGMIRV